MNWNRSSKAVLALAVLLVAAVAPAAAVGVQGDVPNSAQVGAKQETQFTFTDPFSGEYNEWTLQGRTEMTNVTWVVTTYDNTGSEVDRSVLNGQSFDYHLRASDGVTKVTVHLTGTTPPVEQWSYDPPQSFTYATFVQAQEGGSSSVIESWDSVRHYTSDSQRARTQIEDAQAAIRDAESAGADVSEAKSLVANAISAYNAGNFDNAVDLANQAQRSADSAAQSRQLTHWALIGGGIVVVLLLIAGGVWYYLQNRETYDKLA